MSTLEVNKITPSTGTSITLGDSGDTFTIPSGVTLTNNGSASGFGGITEADQWRLTANTSIGAVIATNWERVDTDGFGYLGTGMTESSGIFSFPSTGIYLVEFNGAANAGFDSFIQTTTDNSTYDDAVKTVHLSDKNHSGSFIFDVTNTSTHKVRLNTSSSGVMIGDTDKNTSYFTFIRLGDT